MSAVILRLGDSGPGVAEVRNRLVQLGLLPAANDAAHDSAADVFDAAMDGAVRMFQQSRGLGVDGLVGPRTLRRLEEARWRLGDRVLAFTPGHLVHGEDVATLQTRLLELGFTVDRVDGAFGRITDSAVREFQRNVGLAADGIAGPEVFRALGRLARTVAGGQHERLREASSWEAASRDLALDTLSIMLDPSDRARLVGDSDLRESDVCWDIASRIEGRLSAAGSLVVLSRSAQAPAVGERERARTANEQGLDLVVSIGCDAHPNPQANGAASLYFGHQFSRSAVGQNLADLIQDELRSRTPLRDCRAHGKTGDLLRMTRMPAVRTDIGYVTNPSDAQWLASDHGRDQSAAAVYSAIARLVTPHIG